MLFGISAVLLMALVVEFCATLSCRPAFSDFARRCVIRSVVFELARLLAWTFRTAAIPRDRRQFTHGFLTRAFNAARSRSCSVARAAVPAPLPRLTACRGPDPCRPGLCVSPAGLALCARPPGCRVLSLRFWTGYGAAFAGCLHWSKRPWDVRFTAIITSRKSYVPLRFGAA
jgi:hypothetical protein